MYILRRRNPGFAPIQKRKNVAALHAATESQGPKNLLEISSKSEDEIGRRLSAFSLKIQIGAHDIALESACQGSKVFQYGGPYKDIFRLSPRETKREPILRNSGELIGFEYGEERFPLSPATTSSHDELFGNPIYGRFSDAERNRVWDPSQDGVRHIEGGHPLQQLKERVPSACENPASASTFVYFMKQEPDVTVA